MRRPFVGLVASLLLVSEISIADTPQRITAVLVEAHSMPKCYGLDCPPWTVPDDIDFCFQAGNSFYVGMYFPLPVPWATEGKRLLALEGKPVEIVVTDKHIKVVGHQINLRLRRAHRESTFRTAACTDS